KNQKHPKNIADLFSAVGFPIKIPANQKSNNIPNSFVQLCGMAKRNGIQQIQKLRIVNNCIIRVFRVLYSSCVYSFLFRNSLVNKTNAQWKIAGRFSNNFRIHKIPDPHKSSAGGYGNYDAVHNPQKRFFHYVFCVIIHRDQYRNRSSVACQSLKTCEFKFGNCLYWQKNRKRILHKKFWLIENY